MHVSRLIYLTCLDVGSNMHLPLDSLNWLLQVMVTCLNSPTTYTPLPRCNINKSIGSSLPAFLQAAARPGIGEIMTKCRKRSQQQISKGIVKHACCTIPSMHQLHFHGHVKEKKRFTVLGWLKRKHLVVSFHDFAGRSRLTIIPCTFILLFNRLFSLALAKIAFCYTCIQLISGRLCRRFPIGILSFLL